MKVLKIVGALVVVPIVTGCASTEFAPERTIALRWQRLVTEAGETCDRCGSTQEEVRVGAAVLRRCLQPLGMKVTLEETPMSPEACARDISQSNRVFVNDRPLADWLGGTVGMSACARCCEKLGENVQCRTVTVGGQTFETIPAVLIIRAGLLAAEASLASAATQKPCCPE
ncbi:MAG: DUF2703 domain-containing protein [Phycisphaerales bacterium]|nr:MAG: DUF2703 domain-containing protein [Phycisphaerales bacterium]